MEAKRIDIDDVPELVRLAEEVRASGEPRVLRHDEVEVAVLMPIGRPARRVAPTDMRARTPADDQAFLASAGSWKGIDTGAFLEQV